MFSFHSSFWSYRRGMIPNPGRIPVAMFFLRLSLQEGFALAGADLRGFVSDCREILNEFERK
jgi:hypothetical protein